MKGVAPWQKEWDAPTGAEAPPYNPVSGARYRGLNSIVLRSEAEERGYSDPRWLTFNNAKKLGGHIRKGEQVERMPPRERRAKLTVACLGCSNLSGSGDTLLRATRMNAASRSGSAMSRTSTA